MVFWIAVITMTRHLRKLLNWHVEPSTMQHFMMELVFFMSGLMVGRSFLEMMLVSFTASIILSSQRLLSKKWLKLQQPERPALLMFVYHRDYD
ncbi:unnamed protein product [Musa acuminata subsp. malaccensis]|uniref:(wild Malaysian banana) hypothetical protein n=1 Tax=Musa acuminata subsp. malaccensis TaxID=214687 RepID=A0A804HR52_MUSAM|nr:unnamed protein product [Musa acuminata subsp. malaccensis]